MLCDGLLIAEAMKPGQGALENSLDKRYGASERQAQLRQF